MRSDAVPLERGLGTVRRDESFCRVVKLPRGNADFDQGRDPGKRLAHEFGCRPKAVDVTFGFQD